jgi:hypothetical protein
MDGDKDQGAEAVKADGQVSCACAIEIVPT